MPSTIVKMKHGAISNIDNSTAGLQSVPFESGSVYFATDNAGVGKIWFDDPITNKRIDMTHSGVAVKAAIDALDGTIIGTAGASKTLTAFSQTDGKVSATFGNISITKSQVSDFPTTMTPASHTHGKITNDGKIASTDNVAIANNDRLIISDASDSYILKNTSIVFDGSTETQALTKKGTWVTFNNYSHPTGDGNLHVPATSTTNNGKFLKAGSTAGSISWASLSSSDVTTALGYTPYNSTNPNGYTTNVGTITGVTGSDGLTGSGTSGSVTIKHAAPSTSPAKTTSAVYPITIDKYGHITAAGTAVTAMAPTAHNHDDSYYTKTEIDNKISAVFHYLGTKSTVANLPSSGNNTGDVYHVTADNSEYVWTGSAWEELGTAVDLSNYVEKDGDKVLSSNDFTDTLKSKLEGIAAGATANTGTVTSVRVQASSPLTSSTSTAQTASLNTTISFSKQSANTVLAGPTSGTTTAAPSFRALVASDIPSLNASKITDGTLAVARGGTGVSTVAAGKVFAGPASGNAAAPSFKSINSHTYTPEGTVSVSLSGTSVLSSVKSVGAVPTLGTAFTIPNISKKTVVTGVTKQTVVKTASFNTVLAKAVVSNEILSFTSGASGSATTGDSVTVTTGDSVTVGTAFTVPNVTSVGSMPTFNTGTVGVSSASFTGTEATLSHTLGS